MKIKVFFCLFVVFFLTGCKDSESQFIELSESTFSGVSYEGATLTVEITSGLDWKASVDATWCSLIPTSGTGDRQLVIEVEGNIEESERTAIVTVVGSGVEKKIEIHQNACEGELHYNLPVIFHVFYQDESDPLQYVPQSRLTEILDVVNDLYKKKLQSVDMNLTFTLASSDPDGKTLTTSGVEYIQWPDSYPIDCDKFMKDDDTDDGVGYVKYLWDPNQYINVMIYNFTEDPASMTSTLGISHLPFTTTGSNSLVGLNEVSESYLQLENLSFPYCCSINSLFIFQQSNLIEYNPADVTVTLAHELGHYLGLHHVFSETNESELINDCKDTDYCEDTPSYDKNAYDITYAWAVSPDSNIPSNNLFSYLVKRESCDGTEFTSRNIMDYSVCYSDQFTQDQRDRIRHVLTYSPLIPGPKKRQNKTRSAVDGVLKLPIRVVK